MNAREFLDTFGFAEGGRVAKSAGTTIAYLQQIAGGHRKCSAKLAGKLAKASNYRMTAAKLRPDLAEFFRSRAA